MDKDKRDKQLPVFLGIENNQLSSKHTFLWKYTFMPAWILISLSVMLACSLGYLDLNWGGILFIPLLLGSLYASFLFGRIKKVTLSGSNLIISNFRKTIAIDISQIDSVGGSILINPKLIWLNLKTDTEFGRKIIFAPEQRSPLDFFTGFTKHHL